MKIWLVRHPPTLAMPGVCYGASDVTVAPQALQECAAVLRAQLPQGLHMISSPLQRCEQLAQILSQQEADSPGISLHSSPPYQTDPRLAEMNFGAWELQPWESIPVAQLSAWTDNFAYYACGGSGESTAIFVQRVYDRLQESLARGQDEIWITHAGVIRAMLWLKAHVPQLSPRGLSLNPELLACLASHAWPKDALAFGQMLILDW